MFGGGGTVGNGEPQGEVKVEVKQEGGAGNFPAGASDPNAMQVDAKVDPTQEAEDDSEDELEIVLNTDAVGKAEPQQGPIQLNPSNPAAAAAAAAGFQAKPNYFRQPMMIQQGNQYTKATAAAPSGRPQNQGPTTLAIQTFISSNNSSSSSLVPILGHSAAKKMQLELDIDSIEDKQWRKPGADISDYFNYGFTEDTWRLYCQKQVGMRQESTQLATQVSRGPPPSAVAASASGLVPSQPGTSPLQVQTRQPMPAQTRPPGPPQGPPHSAPVAPSRPLSFQPAGPGSSRPRPNRDQDESVVQVISAPMSDSAAVQLGGPPPVAPAAPSAPSSSSSAPPASGSTSSSSSSRPREDSRRRDDDKRPAERSSRRSRSRSADRYDSRGSRPDSRSDSRSESRPSESRPSESRSGPGGGRGRKRSRSRSPPRGDEKRRRRE